MLKSSVRSKSSLVADSLSVSSTGSTSGILAGASTGTGATVGASNGNISLTTDASSTIEIGYGTTFYAVGPTGQGNVTFAVGTGALPTMPVMTGSPANVTVNPLSSVTPLTTATGFVAAAAGVTLYGEGANIELSNYGSSVNQIIFDGNNFVTADPPAAGLVAPVSVNLPVSLSPVTTGGLGSAISKGASPQTDATEAGVGQGNGLSSPNGINPGGSARSLDGIISGGVRPVVTGEHTVVVENSALSGGSVQALIGTAAGATSTFFSSLAGASSSAANGLGSLSLSARLTR